MEKSDLTKEYKSYYKASSSPELVEIGKAQFLSITGKGDPGDEAFSTRIQALYATAYAVKFICKSRQQDFVVPKLEGLWWYDEQRYGTPRIEDTPALVPRSEWAYRMMIRMPAFVTGRDMRASIKQVFTQKNMPLAATIKPFEMTEGKCVQMLHQGPFDKEPASLQRMADFMQQHSFRRNGLHHEIYLSDFRKTAAPRLRTILREPVL